MEREFFEFYGQRLLGTGALGCWNLFTRRVKGRWIGSLPLHVLDGTTGV
jgi:hypothetical protein